MRTMHVYICALHTYIHTHTGGSAGHTSLYPQRYLLEDPRVSPGCILTVIPQGIPQGISRPSGVGVSYPRGSPGLPRRCPALGAAGVPWTVVCRMGVSEGGQGDPSPHFLFFTAAFGSSEARSKHRSVGTRSLAPNRLSKP